MDYIERMFYRMSLQQIRSFLIYGTEEMNIQPKPYKQLLEEGSKPIYKLLKDIYTTPSELSKAEIALAQALTSYETVYTEIGIKAGARLIMELLHIDAPSSF